MVVKLSDLFSIWETVRRQMVDAVQVLDEKQLDWLPEGGKNSIGDLLRHIAEIENWWFGVVILKQKKLRSVTRESAPGIADILKELEFSHKQVTGVLEKETIESWDKKDYKFESGEVLTMRQIVWHVAEHEMRHRGQIFMIMRLQGLTPPHV
jgi:uncharacterized damage-inducible protein DinB